MTISPRTTSHGRNNRPASESQAPPRRQSDPRFQSVDRGKLIMACGTGRPLELAEEDLPWQTTLGRSVRYRRYPLPPDLSGNGRHSAKFCRYAPLPLCSGHKVSRASGHRRSRPRIPRDYKRGEIDRIRPYRQRLLPRQWRARAPSGERLSVVFTTYQSIGSSPSSETGLPHIRPRPVRQRLTAPTGVTVAGADESAFVKIHTTTSSPAKWRLYMTATPKVVQDGSNKPPKNNQAVLCSMDDVGLAPFELHGSVSGEGRQGPTDRLQSPILTVDEVPCAIIAITNR